MLDPKLYVTHDVSVGGWIAPRLTGEFGAVTLAVPNGYPAYVRIFHPARGRGDELKRWSDVAQATGRRAHRLMQWHAVVGTTDSDNFRGSLCPEWEPERGNLAHPALRALCDILDGHTSTADDCYFALWEGWGGLESYGWVVGDPVVPGRQVGGQTRHVFSAGELSSPRLCLPGRDYVLLAGPLDDSLRIGSWIGADWFSPQSPNLFWPANRAWCVASEIDFDSTLVGGSAGLIEAVLESPELETFAVQPDDSLAYDADTINIVG